MVDFEVDFDVVIAGAGLVGGTLAAALLQQCLRVALVEQRAVEKRDPAVTLTEDFDQRVFAITRASEEILWRLNIWQRLQSNRVSPFYHMQVWEDGGEIHFDSADLGENTLGTILEQQVMQAALLAQLQTLAGLTWFTPRHIEQFERDTKHINLHLDDGQRISATLLVAADGAESNLRQLAGINPRTRDYGHHALVATVETEYPHEETAWQHFLPTGPLAFLPLAEAHTCSIVWSTQPELAAALLAMDEEEFNLDLAEAFSFKLGDIRATRSRGVFPLQQRHAECYTQDRLALVGDAAHTIHPLAGQGVNLGLLDAACLAEVIGEAQRKQRDIGDYLTLRRYERWRKGHNTAMMLAMESFKQLFGARLPGLRWLRNSGLNLTNAAVPVKYMLMRQAMGLDGDLPPLARRVW